MPLTCTYWSRLGESNPGQPHYELPIGLLQILREGIKLSQIPHGGLIEK
jgi:hypothetical protein